MVNHALSKLNDKRKNKKKNTWQYSLAQLSVIRDKKIYFAATHKVNLINENC